MYDRNEDACFRVLNYEALLYIFQSTPVYSVNDRLII